MGKYKYFKLSRGMDADSVYRQYKMLATKHHPDTENGTDWAFQEVGQEYNMIKRLLKVDGFIDWMAYVTEELLYRAGDAYKDTIQPELEPIAKMGFFFKIEKGINKLPEWLKPLVLELRNRSGFDQRVERFDVSEELQKLDAKKMTDKVLTSIRLFKGKPSPANENNP